MNWSRSFATSIPLTVYLLLHQFDTLVLSQSSEADSSDLVRREELLRNLVHNVNTQEVFCSPSAWIPMETDASSKKNPSDDMAHTFRPVFTQLFTPDKLAQNYRWDVHSAVRIVRSINRLQQATQILQRSTLTELLKSMLQAELPVRFHTTGVSSSLGNWTMDMATVTDSAIRNVIICEGVDLLAFASHLPEEPVSNSARDLCSKHSEGQAGSIQESAGPVITFSAANHGSFNLNWLADYCTAVPSQPAAVRLSIQPDINPKQLHFLFTLEIRNFRLDQCALNIHRCGSTTQCEYKQYSQWPFGMDNYICRCTSSYFMENEENGYPAPFIHTQLQRVTGEMLPQFHCRSCPAGCDRCGSRRTCRAHLDVNLLRAIPLALQSFCITACMVLGIAVLRLRRTRVIKAANWVLLEILLIGAVLLYLVVVAMYFPPNDLTCLVLPWLRELGFSIMYGVLIVKIYRILSGFQSRKAHRVHVRDKDILKFLGIFIITTFTYMVAWTAVNLDYMTVAPWNRAELGASNDASSGVVSSGGIRVSMVQRGKLLLEPPIVITTPTVGSSGNTSGNASVEMTLTTNATVATLANLTMSGTAEMVTFDVCRALSWDVVVELAEFIILAVSIHYCRLVRTAPCEYNETLYISVALIIEMTVSGIFNIVRHLIWYSVHPDYVFLLYFARSHITITVNLALIFGPKAWFLYRPSSTLSGLNRSRGPYSTTYSADSNWASSGKLNLAINGDLDIADVNLADMDPEVIRRELKRLYTQIELYKTKAMRKDNPHISKRRGGRKQRRFSLQPFHKRHHGQTGSGTEPMMIPTESGYCWSDYRSSGRSPGGGQGSSSGGGTPSCPKHGTHQSTTVTMSNPGSGSNNRALPAGIHYSSSIVHDEEVSKLSEESTNSTDEFWVMTTTGSSRMHQHLQQQQPLSVMSETGTKPVQSLPKSSGGMEKSGRPPTTES